MLASSAGLLLQRHDTAGPERDAGGSLKRPEIGRGEAASLLGVAPNTASRILSDLTRSGRLTHVANARGAGVRHRLPAATTPYRGGDAAER